MGTVKFPQTKIRWSRDLSFTCFLETMSSDGLFELQFILHFANNETEKKYSREIMESATF